ncbi:MAG: prepilin peptidase [bacterium]
MFWYGEYVKWFYLLLYLGLGLAGGSFLNVLIYRVPLGKSLFDPPSHCPHCGHLIPWHDNIPLLSFFYLRGRCRFCQNPISWRYPVVELATVAIFLSVHLTQPLTHAQKAYYIYFLCVMLALFFIDLEQGIIPDAISYPSLGVGFIGRFLFFPWYSSLLNGVLGGIFYAGVIAGIRWVGTKIFGREAMGVGDIYMAGIIGLFLGWRLSIPSLFLAFLAGGAYAFPLLLSQWLRWKYRPYQEVKFAPFLALGAVLSFFYGENLISWYLYYTFGL